MKCIHMLLIVSAFCERWWSANRNWLLIYIEYRRPHLWISKLRSVKEKLYFYVNTTNEDEKETATRQKSNVLCFIFEVIAWSNHFCFDSGSFFFFSFKHIVSVTSTCTMREISIFYECLCADDLPKDFCWECFVDDCMCVGANDCVCACVCCECDWERPIGNNRPHILRNFWNLFGSEKEIGETFQMEIGVRSNFPAHELNIDWNTFVVVAGSEYTLYTEHDLDGDRDGKRASERKQKIKKKIAFREIVWRVQESG